MMLVHEADTVDVSAWRADGHFRSSVGERWRDGYSAATDAHERGEAPDRRGGAGAWRLGGGRGAPAWRERQPVIRLAPIAQAGVAGARPGASGAAAAGAGDDPDGSNRAS